MCFFTLTYVTTFRWTEISSKPLILLKKPICPVLKQPLLYNVYVIVILLAFIPFYLKLLPSYLTPSSSAICCVDQGWLCLVLPSKQLLHSSHRWLLLPSQTQQQPGPRDPCQIASLASAPRSDGSFSLIHLKLLVSGVWLYVLRKHIFFTVMNIA